MKKGMKVLSRVTMIGGILTFALGSMAFGQLYSGWNNYKDYIMNPNGTGITTNLVKFPVLIRLTSVNAAIFSSPSTPADLRFAKGGNLNVGYSYQVDLWDTVNHQAAIWVLVDTVFSASTSQGIRMYWGNSSAPAASSGTAVFDTGNGFAGVYHFSNNILDATAFARNATVSSATDTVGLIGHARKFVAANFDSVMIPGLMGSPAALTISLWVWVNTVAGSSNSVDVVSLGDNAATRVGENTNIGGGWDSLNCFYYGNGGWQNILQPGGSNFLGQGWRYIAYVVNPAASTQRSYLNGKQVASGALNYAINYSGRGTNTLIGKHGTGQTAYSGLGGMVDEPRIDKVARSADWINFCFATQNANQTAIFEVPAVPTLTSPTNNAVNQPVTPNLTWSMGSRATSYSVLISTSSTFSTTVFGQAGIPTTSVTASGLANSALYYWQVNATNVTLTSAWSSVWSFTTTATLPPAGVPVLISPTNNASNQPLTLSLNWGTVNLATSYGVRVSTNSSFISSFFAQSGLTSQSVTVSGLSNSQLYYWCANAANAGGNGSWSAIWSFTTSGAPPSAAPQLVSPFTDYGGFSIPVILKWLSVTGASSYEVQVGTTGDFGAGSTVFDQTGITGDSVSAGSLLGNNTYYWRVDAWNGSGAGPWSAVWDFGTAGTAILPKEKAVLKTEFSVTDVAIMYSLQAPGAVEISFSDLLGRTALVVNRTQSAGHYAIELKNCKLATGRYLVSFKAAGIEKKASVVITR